MKNLFFLILCFFWAGIAQAQQNVGFRKGNIQSPEINPDNTVTFRLQADKAKQVLVVGDWEANGGKGEMKKNKEGVWEYTSPVLPSEMYTYRFSIDGVVDLDPVNPFTKRDVGNLFSVFFVNGGYADYYQVHDVPHGDMLTTWYHSNRLQADRRLSVYLPPFYGKENKSYPVFYLLHGSGGDETAWVELGNVARIMDNLIAEGKIEPMIVVMPNGNSGKQAAPGETSENHAYKPVMTNQLPGYKNGDYELAFPEIIQFIDTKFRTISDKAHRAIAGLSMGGFHTLYTSINYPGYFDYIGLFSAGLNMTTVDQTLPAYRDLEGKLKGLQQAGYKLFWLAIGNTDFLYEANQDFRKQMEAIDFKYIYHESTRGHIWANWRQYLLLFAPQLFK